MVKIVEWIPSHKEQCWDKWIPACDLVFSDAWIHLIPYLVLFYYFFFFYFGFILFSILFSNF